ncbi:MAG: toprim domain-containing protein, partial [Coriobacteriales bacterium]|nr:toprim domain-containing protein [Coriobacteriales bacterium]
YLAGRGFGGTVATAWKLGYAPGRGELVQHLNKQGFTRDEMLDANLAAYPKDRSTGAPLKGGQLRDVFFNRIVFPIQDLQGRIIAFGGRIVGSGESGPKYLNSADTLLFHKRDNLYAIDRAKATITSGGSAIVVEGYTDVIAMHNVGFTQTVATLGTALTPQHLKLLARFTRRVVLLFDGDEAGQRAADRAVELISVVASPEAGTGADIFVAVLPGAQDPAEYCSSAGASAMQAVLDSAEPLLRFALDRRLAQWDLSQPEQRRRALDAVVPLLVPIKGTLLAADYLNYLADRFLTDYQTVSAVLDKAKPLPAQRSFERSSGGYGESGEAGGAGGASQPAGMRVGGASAGDSGSSVGSTAAQKTPEAARGGSKPFALAYELELLLLYIEHEVTRTRLREAFSLIPWGDDLYQRIADALLTLDVALEPDELLSRLVARCPEASSVLSGSRLPEFREVEPNRLAGMLMFSIKEEQLNSAVRAENAKLHRLAPEDKTAQEAIFKHIADLQQELIDLRKKYSKG